MALARSVIFIALLLFYGSAGAASEKRVALVIGNSAYRNVSALANPARDAEAVAGALRRLGFEVTFAVNQSKAELDATLKDFGDTARSADWAMVYFAGHGVAVEGETYILPVDAKLAYADHVEDEAISLSRLRAKLAQARSLRLVVLDSCRNNPFLATMKSVGQKRAVARGLARPSEPEGDELIAYATRESTTADDGDGAHSPFTEALLANIEEPGIEVGYLFRKVRSDVLAATGQQQSPAIYGELSARQLYFNPSGSGQQTAPVTTTLTMPSAAEWAGVDRNSVSELKTFILHHPSSLETDYARARLRDLETKKASLQPTPSEITATQPKPDKLALSNFAGTWNGVYVYAGRRAPVNFTMYLTIEGTACRGRTEEPNTFGNKTATKLFANISCQLDTASSPPRLVLEKVYDGTGGVSHGVHYSGAVSNDGLSVEGQWNIGSTSGPFSMKR
jgi:hypothetical protein